jgi:uncharacterized protein with HEPN domain
MTLDRTPAHLSDMLAFVRELRAIVGGTLLAEYQGQRVLNLAVEKLFINQGEAAQRVPEADRAGVADVPWRQIIGLRNILAHGYEQVDHETLYRTITTELAAVERALAACLASRGSG